VSETVSAQELRPFQPRVGRTPAQRLQWALDFCNQNLTTLTPGDWDNRRHEFVAFAAVTITPDLADAPWIRKILAGEPWVAAWVSPPKPPAAKARGRPRGARRGGLLVGSAEFQRWTLPSRETLRAVQEEWRRIVVPLLQRDGLTRVGPFTVEVYVHRRDEERRTLFEIAPEGSDPWARWPLLALLGTFADHLRACREPTCRRWFVASRGPQRFCSRTCQNRAGIRAYRTRRAGPKPKRPKPDRTTSHE
jgi:hypothetical protein